MIGLVLVAAGSGQRLGAGVPKALVRVAGRSMIEHCLRTVSQVDRIGQVVVVAPPGRADDLVSTGVIPEGVRVVAGGASRDASVRHGLGVLDAGTQFVLIHDAARPFAPPEVFERVLDALVAGQDAVIPVMPVTDTIKVVRDGVVHSTPVRDELVAVQTPQGFRLDILKDAHATLDVRVTDDAMLVERAGIEVHVVDGSQRSFKITTGFDMRVAESVLAQQDPVVGGSVAFDPTVQEDSMLAMVGIGTDVHAFDPGSPAWVAGLFWPGEVGLAGHSDGDVVAHACADAVLNACGLGDLGGLIGTDRAEYRGASGAEILRAVAVHARKQGFDLVNIGVQMIGNRPRIGPRRLEAQEVLGAAAGCPVHVSATTTDGLGLTGRSEGLAAMATALVTRSR
ncbi:MAG: 2-C-methyl-D-erythritol 4-phosphate cytidylyltransferase [Actinobacteria bacterium]|jgi:2-C-methyl-D-erythritol 4-phosphate cytidylyltransferase/2-C-methyl-D-erythritol 2,4-cyclodiphosphate synthase|nr:2-C-methyl-D-erythritol 4-phosphate cytidylyltransferase [Micrococcales bacterium]MCB0902856.1 2-C-methyl-D-erythritol 4-phosphate cytidylyltransferase [Actinomycetota bacterium]MCO5300033.1 2-C-methyl-D-erythritol 4-phosphate cytidylyltransferase [Candidatus Nanopelagicales bacterium]MCB9429130.1 2-C-methyl-D-erythritol 4-phosphate cytidylyltransferase [Actinomycetota bacterium]HPE13183.1 2-C-methyl-D-erythritol 4-phosphate cytidylyltransferase [Actinomycetota bacterium]